MCRGPANEPYAECRGCHDNIGLLPTRSSVTVIPLGLAVKGGPLAVSLWRYKRADSEFDRRERLAQLVDFFDEHMSHVDTCSGADDRGFDLVTFVPGTKSPGANPVHQLLRASSWAGTHHVADALRLGADSAHRDHHGAARKFHCPAPLHHRSVLLVDDTWTTGANALSAAAALLRAGAGHVTIVVLGRHLDPSYGQGEEFVARCRRQPAGRLCALCPSAAGTYPAPTRGTGEPHRPARPEVTPSGQVGSPTPPNLGAAADLPTYPVRDAVSANRLEPEAAASWDSPPRTRPDGDWPAPARSSRWGGLGTLVAAVALIGLLAVFFALAGVGDDAEAERELVTPSKAQLRAAVQDARQFPFLSSGGPVPSDQEIEDYFLQLCQDYLVRGRADEARSDAENEMPEELSSEDRRQFIDFLDFMVSEHNPYC